MGGRGEGGGVDRDRGGELKGEDGAEGRERSRYKAGAEGKEDEIE